MWIHTNTAPRRVIGRKLLRRMQRDLRKPIATTDPQGLYAFPTRDSVSDDAVMRAAARRAAYRFDK